METVAGTSSQLTPYYSFRDRNLLYESFEDTLRGCLWQHMRQHDKYDEIITRNLENASAIDEISNFVGEASRWSQLMFSMFFDAPYHSEVILDCFGMI